MLLLSLKPSNYASSTVIDSILTRAYKPSCHDYYPPSQHTIPLIFLRTYCSPYRPLSSSTFTPNTFAVLSHRFSSLQKYPHGDTFSDKPFFFSLIQKKPPSGTLSLFSCFIFHSSLMLSETLQINKINSLIYCHSLYWNLSSKKSKIFVFFPQNTTLEIRNQ